MTDTKQGGPEPVKPEVLQRRKGRTGTFVENGGESTLRLKPSFGPKNPDWLEEDKLPPGFYSDSRGGVFW